MFGLRDAIFFPDQFFYFPFLVSSVLGLFLLSKSFISHTVPSCSFLLTALICHTLTLLRAISRPLRAAYSTLPVVLSFFIPVFFLPLLLSSLSACIWSDMAQLH